MMIMINKLKACRLICISTSGRRRRKNLYHHPRAIAHFHLQFLYKETLQLDITSKSRVLCSSERKTTSNVRDKV